LIFDSSKFVFEVPETISRARRVLIKTSSGYPISYPVTTSREMLSSIIEGVRQVSDADIILLDGTPGGGPIHPIYQALGYDFPRVLALDVKDCVWVEVDNPLPKALAVPTFWVPNVVLSSDYLISVAPMKVVHGRGSLSITNLLSLLPNSKYDGDVKGGWQSLYSLGIDKVIADLYYTLPFDMGIVEGHQQFTSYDDPTKGDVEACGKIFIGEPFEVDSEASEAMGIKTGYLDYIKEARIMLEQGQ
jgi:hypothetical protein